MTAEHEHTLTGEKLSLLVVFAHPEDEAFGPAGTLARYASEGIQVSLVTAARETAAAPLAAAGARLPAPRVAEPTPAAGRETLCSCRTLGIQRNCLIDAASVTVSNQESALEERLVREIRELKPQVIVTYGTEGLFGDEDRRLINRVTTRAFQSASDVSVYPLHLQEGLTPYSPQKLYYSVLPESLVARWGIPGLVGVPDYEITTVLDVSPYTEAKLRALYCARNQAQDYGRWRAENEHLEWDKEYFVLHRSRLGRKPRREKDLFAGLR